MLVLQTSATVLLMRYTRTHDNGQPYFPTSIVFLTECVKYIICAAQFLRINDKKKK